MNDEVFTQPAPWEAVERWSGRDRITSTERLRVFGGWLVRSFICPSSYRESSDPIALSTVFVPDPDGAWTITPPVGR